MKTKPYISPTRAAEIFKTMLEYRRGFCADTEFFKMTGVLKDLFAVGEGWSLKTYRSGLGDNYVRRAGVIAFNNRVTMTMDQELWDRADGGCRFANFVLAHEFGHLALDHHAQNAVIKNFVLYPRSGSMCNVPPNTEELEANFAATFFQCGIALFDEWRNPTELARRACSDSDYIKKIRLLFPLESFQREWKKTPSVSAFPRVIL